MRILLSNDPIITVLVLGGLILLLLIIGTPLKPVQLVGRGIVKVMIGALLLFFLNTFGQLIGVHVPINFITASISGFLGLPGIIVLVAIKQFVLI